jgi:hypothetical protein
MPQSSKKEVTVKYEFNEILELIEKNWGSSLKVELIDIKESGCVDTGDYKREIKSITFKEI